MAAKWLGTHTCSHTHTDTHKHINALTHMHAHVHTCIRHTCTHTAHTLYITAIMNP